MQKETIKIDNLSCGHCVKTVTNRLESIEGIQNVNVVLETSTLTLEHDENITRDIIVNELDEIGYPEHKSNN